jgi:hypothetical protein
MGQNICRTVSNLLHIQLIIIRYLKDKVAIMLLHKVVWNYATEHDIIHRVQNMGLDVFEMLKRELAPENNRTPTNLTFRYFASKVLHKIHSKMWINNWKDLLNDMQQGKHVTMMDGALLFCNKNIYFDVQKEVFEPLNQLVSLVKKELGDGHNDPIQILSAIIKVMAESGFVGDTTNYYNVANWYVFVLLVLTLIVMSTKRYAAKQVYPSHYVSYLMQSQENLVSHWTPLQHHVIFSCDIQQVFTLILSIADC